MIGISAGNHAQALAWGARSGGIDALVVMWQGASEAKIAADARATAPRSTSRPAARPSAFERLDEPDRGDGPRRSSIRSTTRS